jgi:hypothetical protein
MGTLVSGFKESEHLKELDCTNKEVIVLKPLRCNYHTALPELLNEVFDQNSLYSKIKNAVIYMVKQFIQLGAHKLFEQKCDIKFNLNENTYDQLVEALLTHKSYFMELCSQRTIRMLNNNEWYVKWTPFIFKLFLGSYWRIYSS